MPKSQLRLFLRRRIRAIRLLPYSSSFGDGGTIQKLIHRCKNALWIDSNLPEVELFANGVSLGKKEAADHFFYFDVPNVGETKLEAVAGGLRDESTIRKVDKMNPDYILREQGAVLNWFDITEIEGRFSLNDKLGDIIKTFRGKLWFAGLFLILAKKQSGPKQKTDKKAPRKKQKANMDSGVMNMISSFTVLRFTGMLGMRNINFTKEELLKLNRQLNKIKKSK